MEWSGMALFYFGCLAFGFLGALVGVIFGELGGHFHIGGVDHGIHLGGDHAVDVGHSGGHDFGDGGHGANVGAGQGNGMPGASVFNSITIATFFGFFGIAGLVAVWGLKLGPLTSLAFALPTSVVIAATQFMLYVKIFIRAQASSEATLSDVLGCEASVISGIPADRVGQITYVIKGSRFTAPAVSADGDEIPRGSKVLIVNIRGVTLVVRPS